MNLIPADPRMSVKLTWLLKDVLPVLVNDARIVEREHHELSEQVNQLAERKLTLGKRLEALGGAVSDLADLAMFHGCNEEQLAAVVGAELARTKFTVPEF